MMTDVNMSGGGDGAIVELVQSRNASATEALAIMRAQVKAFKQRLAAARGYRSIRIVLAVIASVLLTFLITDPRLKWTAHASPLLVLALFALLGAGACRIWVRYYYKACADVYRESYKANRQFRIEKNALVTTLSGVISSVPWGAISDIIVNDDFLIIYLSPVESICLPKYAFEGQDVDGFCTELQRRWQQGKARTPAAA